MTTESTRLVLTAVHGCASCAAVRAELAESRRQVRDARRRELWLLTLAVGLVFIAAAQALQLTRIGGS